MPRPQQPPRDLSTKGTNSTSELQRHYQQLMSIQDPDELTQAAINIVRPLVGKGVSEQNYRKFTTELQKAAMKGLTNIQMYISNYILSGSGLSVGRGLKETIDIHNIGTMINEDINYIKELTPTQKRLKHLIESNTKFTVILN